SESPEALGGTYSATPAGLSLNANTGAINVSGSTPGVYEVTYYVPENACTAETSHTVEIEIIERTASVVDFSYDEVCINAINDALRKLADGLSNGVEFSSDTLVSNPTSSEIKLYTATFGTHTIMYTVSPDAEHWTSGGTSTATIVI